MERKLRLLAVAAISTLIGMGAALAQDQDRDQLRTRDPDRLQTPDQDRLRAQNQIRDRDIYGYQLMTPQERNEYRNRMRAATTQQERERIRAEHHAQMQGRAQERGITLPAEPPMGRPGMGGPEAPMTGPGPRGPGGGMGGGMRR
jgi:hypothetical protein